MAKPHLAHGFLGLRPLLTPDLEVFSRVFWRLKLRSPDRPISISDIAAYVDRISRTTDFELFVHLLSEMENAYHETLARFEDRHDDPRRRVN